MILVAGEALIDILPVPGSQHRLDARPGGAPFNVAVGLARLGRQTRFLGRIGSDTFGRLLREKLQDAGVDLSMAVTAPETTTLAVSALDASGKADYSFYANGTADWQWTESEVPRLLPDATQALYAGGLALRLLPGAAVLERLVQRARRQGNILIFLDPNVRGGFGFDAASERARVERQIELAHVVKASEDDIALLYPDREYREIAAVWQRQTGAHVIVTLGTNGAYALTAAGRELTVPAAPARVVDTVGAGDAFAAALLHGLASEIPHGTDPAAALHRINVKTTLSLLERASISAAFTCEQAGADCADTRTLDDLVKRAQRRRHSPEPAHHSGRG